MDKMRKIGRNILSHAHVYFYTVWVIPVPVFLYLLYILESAGELLKIAMPRLYSIPIKSESVCWDPGSSSFLKFLGDYNVQPRLGTKDQHKSN